ncbi:MFS transporter [Priestia koreensis]|uniref:MFS transporter n=1 Tax=Priestia koreensis TaxID=284581 RepID=UPI00203C0009|nr:MFS transporter [Priestia koreensis]
MILKQNRDFMWLVSGQTVSTLGSAVSGFAVPWLVLEITGSALQMGFVFTCGFLSYLFFILPAGVWADRHDRKKIMLGANIGKMLLILSLPLTQLVTGELHIWHLYLVRSGMGVCDALFDASYGACLPRIVEREQLKKANSIMQMGISASSIAGPAIAGVLVTQIGAANTLLVDGMSYIFSITTLLFIKQSLSTTSAPAKKHMGKEMIEGLAYIWKYPTIRTLSILTFVSNIANAAMSVVFLYRLQQELHLSSDLSGLIMTGFSIGAIVASFFSTFLSSRFTMKMMIYLLLSIQIIPPLIIGLSSQPFLLMAAMIVMGGTGVIWNIYSVSLRQSLIPNEMLGRAGASIRLTVWASAPLGQSSAGALAEVFGSIAVYVLASGLRIGNLLLAVKSPITDEKTLERESEKIANSTVSS